MLNTEAGSAEFVPFKLCGSSFGEHRQPVITSEGKAAEPLENGALRHRLCTAGFRIADNPARRPTLAT
jgi:hypothetical protein